MAVSKAGLMSCHSATYTFKANWLLRSQDISSQGTQISDTQSYTARSSKDSLMDARHAGIE